MVNFLGILWCHLTERALAITAITAITSAINSVQMQWLGLILLVLKLSLAVPLRSLPKLRTGTLGGASTPLQRAEASGAVLPTPARSGG